MVCDQQLQSTRTLLSTSLVPQGVSVRKGVMGERGDAVSAGKHDMGRKPNPDVESTQYGVCSSHTLHEATEVRLVASITQLLVLRSLSPASDKRLINSPPCAAWFLWRFVSIYS